jgi:hypothetical protein
MIFVATLSTENTTAQSIRLSELMKTFADMK